MATHDLLTERFEANRSRLQAMAVRMLGASGEADDVIQEAWLRLHRSDADRVENLDGWLTTVVGRICLDTLRSRKTRRESPLRADAPSNESTDEEAMLAQTVGPAMSVVLDVLSPAERVAFVLHDVFDVPFDGIAAIVGRSPEATRQLASRARRRVKGVDADPDADLARQWEVVEAFRAASRHGDLEALIAVLAPDIVLRADAAAVAMGATAEVRDSAEVAAFFLGRAQAARRALVDGSAGLAWVVGGTPRVVFRFSIIDGKVAKIELIANSESHRQMDLVLTEPS